MKSIQGLSTKSNPSAPLVCNLSLEYKKLVKMAHKHGYSQEKYSRFESRFGQMSIEMQQQIMKNPEYYIKDFEVGGKYNMLIFEKEVRGGIEAVEFGIQVSNGRIFSLNELDTLTKVNALSGNYTFIIQKGKIKMMPGGARDSLGNPFKHSDLARNGNVDRAGIINFNQGKISIGKGIQNNTGHYKTGVDLFDKETIKKAFDSVGYDTKNILDLIYNYK